MPTSLSPSPLPSPFPHLSLAASATPQHFSLSTIIAQAKDRGYTDLVIVNQNMRRAESLTVCHLPRGPTAYFKLSSIVWPQDIGHAAKDSGHYPEVLTTNFKTRLGKQVSRMFQAHS